MAQKTEVKLLALQMGSNCASIEENIHKVEQLLRKKLSSKEVDFVFLPEVWTCGWDCSCFKDCAETLEDSKAVNMLKTIAKEFSVNIIG